MKGSGVRRPAPGWLVLVALAALRCGSEPAPPDVGPELAAALSLIEAARGGEPSDADLALWVAGEPLRSRRATLLDALETLRGAADPRVEDRQVMGEVGKASLDVRLQLARGGDALYRVQTVRDLDGAWRVAWLAGPGVEWPTRRAPRESLSSSAPPR